MFLQRFKFSLATGILIAAGLFLTLAVFVSVRGFYRGHLAHRLPSGAESSAPAGIEEAVFSAHEFKISGWAPAGAAVNLSEDGESAADTVAGKDGKWDLSFSGNGKRAAHALSLASEEKGKPAATAGELKYFIPAAAQDNAFIWWQGGKDKSPFILQSPAGEESALFLSQVFASGEHPLLFAGRAAAGTLVHLYVDGQLAGKAQADAKGFWLLQALAGADKKAAVLRLDGINKLGRVAARRAYHLAWPEDKDEGGGKLAVVNAGDDGWILGEGQDGSRELVYLLKPEAGETEAPETEIPGQVIPAPPPE